MRVRPLAYIGSFGLSLLVPLSAFAIPVADCTDLQDISDDLSESYTQTADIDCTGVDFTPLGTVASRFTGSYDGNGFVIENLVINKSGTQAVGIFGATSDAATITGIGYVSGSVTGNRFVGAIVGYHEGELSESFSFVDIVATNTDPNMAEVGGLAGVNAGTIADSYATGDVSSAYDGGGLVGYNDGAITRSYATGNVTGEGDNMGGLIGRHESATVSHVFATGTVGNGASSSGGLIGVKPTGSVSNGFWLDGQGTPNRCYEGGDTGCTALTDVSHLYQAANAPLSSWDFDTVWSEQTGALPLLAWQEDTIAPPAPTSFSAATSSDDITLHWSTFTYGDFDHMVIRRSLTSFPSGASSGASVRTSGEGTSFVDTDLGYGTYYYGIFAVDANGNVSAPTSLLVELAQYSVSTVTGGGGVRRSTLETHMHHARSVSTPSADPSEMSEKISIFQINTCKRVKERFPNNLKMRSRINERLMRRFQFTCED